MRKRARNVGLREGGKKDGCECILVAVFASSLMGKKKGCMRNAFGPLPNPLLLKGFYGLLMHAPPSVPVTRS